MCVRERERDRKGDKRLRYKVSKRSLRVGEREKEGEGGDNSLVMELFSRWRWRLFWPKW